MAKIILTRYLYILDECIHSFIYSLLKKQPIEQVYFWISEIYLSGFKTRSWDLLWYVYFDFYFINNPTFYSFIDKKQNTYTLKDLLTVVKNLYKFIPSSQIFITRQYNSQIKQIDYIFRGRKPSWLNKDYSNKFHGLFRFLKKKLYHFAVSSIPQHIDDDLWASIKTFYNLNDDTMMFIQKSYDITYSNSQHKIWAIFSLLEFNPLFYSNKNKLYISISESEINTILEIHNSPIPLSPNKQLLQIYKTLSYKRIYSIPKEISSFYLAREQVDNINHLIWYNWQYYAYYSPIWKERFDNYDITIDDDKQLIIFNNDGQLEDFHQQWGYDPDEQTFETMDKRMYETTDYYWKHWYNKIFNDHSIYQFEDEFKFIY